MKRLILTIGGLAIFTTLWWAFSPLLFNQEVNEQLDPNIQSALEQTGSDETTSPSGTTSVVKTGPFPITGTTGHPASGSVELIKTLDENLVHYQNYDGTNGPDLYVYLAKDLGAEEFVDLGQAKGNKGSIIYEIPLDIDTDEYQYVMTWCKAFGVLFDYAKIN